jgi:hypothetical protein
MSGEMWMVSSGEYSDYGVRAVFTTKEKAEEFCRHHNGDDKAALRYGDEYRVESVEVDPELENMKTLTYVLMRRDGAVDTIGKQRNVVYEYFHPGPSHYAMGLGHRFGDGNDRQQLCLQWYVDTTDEELAVKVVAEKRAEILAAGIWGDNEKTKAYFEAKQ